MRVATVTVVVTVRPAPMVMFVAVFVVVAVSVWSVAVVARGRDRGGWSCGLGLGAVVAAAGDEMVGLEEGFGGEVFDVLVASGIEDAGAVAAGADEAGGAQLGEVLGDGRRPGADVVGELVDRVLPVEQGPHDLQSGGVGEQLEYAGGDVELDVVRLHAMFANLRSHAGSVSPGRSG